MSAIFVTTFGILGKHEADTITTHYETIMQDWNSTGRSISNYEEKGSIFTWRTNFRFTCHNAPVSEVEACKIGQVGLLVIFSGDSGQSRKKTSPEEQTKLVEGLNQYLDNY